MSTGPGKTLSNLRIVVTRAAHQAEELAAPLRDRGADVILVPVIGIAPPADPEPLARAARERGTYDWILFTSANTVMAFAAVADPAAGAHGERYAAIGAATREIAETHGFPIALMPEEAMSESLAAAFAEEDLRGLRILLPSAAVTRDLIAPALRGLGAEVETVIAYRTVIPEDAYERAKGTFREPFPDWVTFASASAVENLVTLAVLDALRRVRSASIGSVTSRSLREHGLTVSAEAETPGVPGLLAAIENARQ